MKITKTQLRKMIKEELSLIREIAAKADPTEADELWADAKRWIKLRWDPDRYATYLIQHTTRTGGLRSQFALLLALSFKVSGNDKGALYALGSANKEVLVDPVTGFSEEVYDEILEFIKNGVLPDGWRQ